MSLDTIDAATGAVLSPTDVDGNPRVLFGQSDLGAHEFGALGETGVGNSGAGAGGPFDLLTIDGSAGGPARVIERPFGQAAVLEIAQPPTSMVPSRFLIWGVLEVGGPHSPYLSPIGLMSFTPLHADPSRPLAFVLANSIDLDPAALQPAGLAPYAFRIPPIFFPVRATIQAAIEDTSLTTMPPFSITNGIVYAVF